MKKVIIAILVSIIFFPTMTFAQTNLTTIVNNNKVELTNEKYNKLKSMGFTDSQIMFFDQETVNRNLSSNGTLIAQDVSYLKTISTNNSINHVKVKDIELTKEQYEYETSHINNEVAQTNVDDEHIWGV